ncbi:MAG: ATP-binding protein [Pseudonocardiales bacterium]
MDVSLTLDGDPQRVAEARRMTERTLASWGLSELADTAALLVSELMTNAVLHARSGVVVTLRHDTDKVRVEVFDGSPLPPRMRHFRADAGTGRGVRLLDTLASEWGIEGQAGGKVVWFTLGTGEQPAAQEWDFDFDALEPL